MTLPSDTAMRDERKPKRIQMTRQKPWRCDNPDAVIVARPGKWKNPFKVGSELPSGLICPDNESAAGYFEIAVNDDELRERFNIPSIAEIATDLRGKDLACWCGLNDFCHAEVLLRLANK